MQICTRKITAGSVYELAGGVGSRRQLTSSAEVGQVVGSPGVAVDRQASGRPGVGQPGIAGVAGVEQAGPTGRGTPQGKRRQN